MWLFRLLTIYGSHKICVSLLALFFCYNRKAEVEQEPKLRSSVALAPETLEVLRRDAVVGHV